MVELGSGRLVPGFEEQLDGRRRRARSARSTSTFPDDYRRRELAGKTAAVRGRRSRRSRPRSCPSSTTSSPGERRLRHARRAARGHPRPHARGRDARRSRPSSARRRSTPPSPRRPSRCPTRSSRRARASCGTRCSHSLSHQGISKEAYLRISGETEDEIVEEAQARRRAALRREAVLAAIVEAEGIEPTEEELLEAVGSAAEREGTTPEKLLERLEPPGASTRCKRGPRRAQGGGPASPSGPSRSRSSQAQAREKLWTPGDRRARGRAASGGGSGRRLLASATSERQRALADRGTARATLPGDSLKDSSARSETKRGP